MLIPNEVSQPSAETVGDWDGPCQGSKAKKLALPRVAGNSSQDGRNERRIDVRARGEMFDQVRQTFGDEFPAYLQPGVSLSVMESPDDVFPCAGGLKLSVL